MIIKFEKLDILYLLTVAVSKTSITGDIYYELQEGPRDPSESNLSLRPMIQLNIYNNTMAKTKTNKKQTRTIGLTDGFKYYTFRN